MKKCQDSQKNPEGDKHLRRRGLSFDPGSRRDFQAMSESETKRALAGFVSAGDVYGLVFTGVHAMAAAKCNGDRYFFDPNMGQGRFKNEANFKKSVVRFLREYGTATRCTDSHWIEAYTPGA